MNNENEYIQIDLLKIANGLLKRFWAILIATVLGGALLFSYATFYITPLYESSVLLYVNNSSML
jgi:capsular polysaccharide biosynthesis protein